MDDYRGLRSDSNNRIGPSGDLNDDGGIRLVEESFSYPSRSTSIGKGKYLQQNENEEAVGEEDNNIIISPPTLLGSRHAFHNSTASTILTDGGGINSNHEGIGRAGELESFSRNKPLNGFYPDNLRMPSNSSSNNTTNNSIPNLSRNLSNSLYPATNTRGDAESMRGERATWYSDYNEEGENSTNGLGIDNNEKASARDSFPLSMTSSFPSQQDINSRLSNFSIHPPNPNFARNSSASSYSAPTFRIGNSSPSPTTPITPDQPLYEHSPPHLTVQTSPSKSLTSPLNYSNSSPISGRSPSLSYSTNFSRPFSGENQNNGASYRSTSFDSGDGRSMRESISGRSVSGQSIGGHSMSGSWDGRQQMERNRYEFLLSPQNQYLPNINTTTSGPSSPNPDSNSNGSISPSISSNRSRSNSNDYSSNQSNGNLSPIETFFPSPTSPTSVKSSGKSKRWSIFRSKSKSKLQTNKEVPEEDTFHNEKLSSPPPVPINTPEFNLKLAPLVGLFQSTSHSSGLTEDEWSKQEKRRSEQMIFKPSVGKSVLASYVSGGEGEEFLPPGWKENSREDRMERIDEKSSSSLSSPIISNINKFDLEGPKRLLGMHHHPRDSILSTNYSIYSLPADDNESRTSSTPTMRQGSPQFNRSSTPTNNGRPGTAMSTMEKTKFHLPGKSNLSNDPQVAEDFLLLGIDFHEAGELERSAWNFEQSAKRNGGCGAGMLMYGLALRSGWGVQVNAPLGFHYLQKAAETVVDNLDHLPGDAAGTKVAKNELVLALYELGISYRLGLGVTKDKKMAVSYYEMAANLGDPDAQTELAFCYANGKGCKKDMKMAAKYYRMAVAQGAQTFGLSWIFKPKYMDD